MEKELRLHPWSLFLKLALFLQLHTQYGTSLFTSHFICRDTSACLLKAASQTQLSCCGAFILLFFRPPSRALTRHVAARDAYLAVKARHALTCTVRSTYFLSISSAPGGHDGDATRKMDQMPCRRSSIAGAAGHDTARWRHVSWPASHIYSGLRIQYQPIPTTLPP